MNSVLHGVFGLVIYTVVCTLFLVFAQNSYVSSIGYRRHRKKRHRRKLSITLIIVVSFAFALFNWYNSINGFMGEDRQNYYMDFFGRLTHYSGFDWYLQTLRTLTQGDYYLTLYITTFICCVAIFLSYK